MAIPSGGLIHKYDLLDPACYPGSGTVITDTVGSLDLDITGSPTFDSTQGYLTWNANGVGAYSTIGQYANITTTFTVSIWIKINDASVSQLIFNNGNRAGSMSGYSSFFDGTGSDLIDFGGNNVWGMASGSALAQDQWYNLTYTLDSGANEGKIYINGVLSSTSGNGVGNAYGVNDFLALGGTGSSTGSPTLQNKSSYGVVLLYNTTLNATQVGDIYNTYVARFNPPVHEYDAADPASYPGSGSTLTDIGSATPINLSLANATFDNVNDSFALNGTSGSYIRSANSLAGFDIGANDFSVQLWFKYDGVTAQPPYNIFLQIGSRTGGGFSGFTFSTFSGEFTIGKPGVADYSTGFNPVIGTWYLATMTVNSSNDVTLYINGTSVYTQTISFVTPDNIIAMGDNGIQTDQVANASVGPLQIYDRVLSNTEITNYYNGTFYRFNPGKVYLNASEPASAVAPYTTWSDLSNNYDFTMYSPSFTPVSAEPAYYSFPSRDYTTPVSVYGEYNGTPAVTSTNNFTGYFWVRRNADHGSFTQNRLSIFANGREDLLSASNGWSYGTYNNPNAANDNVVIERAGFGIIDSGYTFSNATWINIAITVNSSNVVTFYQDGEIFGGPGFSFSATTPADGMWISRTAGSFFSWMGDISIIRQYDYALTQAQIQELYNYDYETYITPTPPPPPPVAGNVGGRTFGQGFAG